MKLIKSSHGKIASGSRFKHWAGAHGKVKPPTSLEIDL